MRKTTVALLVALLFLTPIVSASEADTTPHGSSGFERAEIVTRTIESKDGIEFTVRFDEDRSTLRLTGMNTNGQDVESSGIVVTADGSRIFESTMNISTSETWSRRIDYEPGIDALEKHHSVTVSTFGNYTRFNFTRTVEPNRTEIPTPYISSVKIQNGTIDGEPSSVANVTVVNPSMQTYPTKLMVHTTGTDGSFYAPSVVPGESRTITVELLDDRGSMIAGEARLYAGNFSKGDGAMDQVEFVGQAGAATESWNRSYEPVTGPWDERSYAYENESLDPPTFAEEVSAGLTFGGYPLIYSVGGGLVVLTGLFRRLR